MNEIPPKPSQSPGVPAVPPEYTTKGAVALALVFFPIFAAGIGTTVGLVLWHQAEVEQRQNAEANEAKAAKAAAALKLAQRELMLQRQIVAENEAAARKASAELEAAALKAAAEATVLLETNRAELGLEFDEMELQTDEKVDLPKLEETLAKAKATQGLGNADTLLAVNKLAAAYMRAGKADKALPLYAEARAAMEVNLGPNHPKTLSGMTRLAAAFQAAGQQNAAIDLLEVTLQRKKSTDPKGNHASTLSTMHQLAKAYQTAGKFARAVSLYELELEGTRARFGREDSRTLAKMESLVAIYFAGKERTKATLLLNELLTSRRKFVTAEEATFAGHLLRTGHELLKVEQAADAEPILRQCLEIRVRLEPDFWSTFDARVMLGTSLLGQKKYAEAEPLLREGYAGLRKREKTLPPEAIARLTEIAERLVQLYDATGNAAEAERWRKELAARKP